MKALILRQSKGKISYSNIENLDFVGAENKIVESYLKSQRASFPNWHPILFRDLYNCKFDQSISKGSKTKS